MPLKPKRVSSLVGVLAALMLVQSVAVPQEEATRNDTTPKIRLRSPARVKGFIGGESHDGYVIHAHKGQIMNVRISWRRVHDNFAEFNVSESPDGFSGAPLESERQSKDRRRWTVQIPRTGDYYIYVFAHPSAHYTLRVSLK